MLVLVAWQKHSNLFNVAPGRGVVAGSWVRTTRARNARRDSTNLATDRVRLLATSPCGRDPLSLFLTPQEHSRSPFLPARLDELSRILTAPRHILPRGESGRWLSDMCGWFAGACTVCPEGTYSGTRAAVPPLPSSRSSLPPVPPAPACQPCVLASDRATDLVDACYAGSMLGPQRWDCGTC